MTQAQLTQNWAINPNVRKTPFVSLNDTAGWWLFQNHTFLIANGWTVQYTCNGTTGPTSGSDHTDRLTTQANCQTRGANAASAQSFSVLNSGDGAQLMLTYQGATDDVLRVSYSPGGLFTIASPSTNQPTATDEVVISTGTTIVNATASADRVMSIWSTTNGKNWSMAIFRQSALVIMLGVERINNMTPTGVFVPPYVGYRYNLFDRNALPGGSGPNYDPHNVAIGTSGWFGTAARVFALNASRLTRLIAGGWDQTGQVPGQSRVNSGVFTTNSPALQGGGPMPVLPPIFSGENAVGLDGILGWPVDWWFGYSSATTTPALGDFMPGFEPTDNPNVDPSRTNWLLCMGASMIRPWRNAAPSLQIT